MGENWFPDQAGLPHFLFLVQWDDEFDDCHRISEAVLEAILGHGSEDNRGLEHCIVERNAARPHHNILELPSILKQCQNFLFLRRTTFTLHCLTFLNGFWESSTKAYKLRSTARLIANGK